MERERIEREYIEQECVEQECVEQECVERECVGQEDIESDYMEYVTFHIKAKDGTDVEMAVVDEFDFENKHYIVGAVVKDDTILDDGRYIYRSVIKGDDFTVEKITREFEYKKVIDAYMSMDEDES